MKISFTRGFDTEDVLKGFQDAKVQGAEEFVNNVAETIDKLSQFVQKNITLADNVDQATKSYLMYHGRSLLVDSPHERKKVKAIIPISTSGWANPITSFNWRYNDKGKIEMIAWFRGDPTDVNQVTVSIFH